MQDVLRCDAQRLTGGFEDRRVRLGGADVACGNATGEIVADAGAAEVGIAVGQADQGKTRRQPVECRQAVSVKRDVVACTEKSIEGRLDERIAFAAEMEGVLQRQFALCGEVVRELRMGLRDLFAQMAHGRYRELFGGDRRMRQQEIMERRFGALDDGPDRPKGVVQIEADGFYGMHPDSIPRLGVQSACF